MISREVKYERNLTGSYLKVPEAFNGEFDEKLMLKKKIKGLLNVEKSYWDGQGQYWYDITGLQSLDTFCHIREPEYSFVEKLILCICDEVEILEDNLLSPECLMFDPEFIFLSQRDTSFFFLIYPGSKSDGMAEFQKLMDYLITKISHGDTETVRKTYALYELIRQEGNSIGTIRDAVMKQKEERILAEHPEPEKKAEEKEDVWEREKEKAPRNLKKQSGWDRIKVILFGEKFAKKIGSSAPPKKSEKAMRAEKWKLCSSDDLSEEPDREMLKKQMELEEECKTVFIRVGDTAPEGILMYDGKDGLDIPDIVIREGSQRVGSDAKSDVQIKKDTISHFHVCLTREENNYYIEDLNSTNGTFLNDELLPYKEKKTLKINDKIRLADVSYRFV